MSQAEDLLNALTNEDYDHSSHTVADSDNYFIIDPITRVIHNTTNGKNVLMQGDHNSERFTFELSRFIEEHDMSLCNVVKLHYINIDSTGRDEYADLYDIVDLRIDPANEDKVICSWLISRQATQYAGSLNFLIQFQCTGENGHIPYEWNTDICSDIIIKKSMNNGEQTVVEHSDLLEQWRSTLATLTNVKHVINLPKDNWVISEDGSHYFQTLDIEVRNDSQINLQPTPQQFVSLIALGISMFIGNESGVAIACSIGGVPNSDMTIQAIETVVTNL